MIRVTEAKWVRDFVIHLRFNDGLEGEVDLCDELYGPVFEPLRDVTVFRAFELHPEFHTLVWRNGADFAPEFLHNRLRVPHNERFGADVAPFGKGRRPYDQHLR